jgi:tetratricopeptide (TPR) repeat protein
MEDPNQFEYEKEGMFVLADMTLKQAEYVLNDNNSELLFFARTKHNRLKELLHFVFEMGDSRGYYKLAMYYKKIGNFQKFETCLIENIEKYECVESMIELGMYYDDESEYENMIKYYLMAAKYDSVTAIYNLTQYYRVIYDIHKMKDMIERGIELGDADCAYEMALYYEMTRDYKQLMDYYLIALEMKTNSNNVNNGIKGFNVLILYNLLKLVENPSMNVKYKIQELLEMKACQIYKNKIALFTKLNHIEECDICYETKLKIDIKCGHTFCIDCYPMIYNKCCPLCRIK